MTPKLLLIGLITITLGATFSRQVSAEERGTYPFWITVKDSTPLDAFPEKYRNEFTSSPQNLIDTSTLREDLARRLLQNLRKKQEVRIKWAPRDRMDSLSTIDFPALRKEFGDQGSFLELSVVRKGFYFNCASRKNGEVCVFITVKGRLYYLDKQKIAGKRSFIGISKPELFDSLLANHAEKAREAFQGAVSQAAGDIDRYYRGRILTRAEYFPENGYYFESGTGYGMLLRPEDRDIVRDGMWFDGRLGLQLTERSGIHLLGGYFISEVHGTSIRADFFKIGLGFKYLWPLSTHLAFYMDLDPLIYGRTGISNKGSTQTSSGLIVALDGSLQYKPVTWFGIGPYIAVNGSVTGSSWFVSGLLFSFNL